MCNFFFVYLEVSILFNLRNIIQTVCCLFLVFQVNDGAKVSGSSFAPLSELNLETPLYLGGYPHAQNINRQCSYQKMTIEQELAVIFNRYNDTSYILPLVTLSKNIFAGLDLQSKALLNFLSIFISENPKLVYFKRTRLIQIIPENSNKKVFTFQLIICHSHLNSTRWFSSHSYFTQEKSPKDKFWQMFLLFPIFLMAINYNFSGKGNFSN